jgi:ankyrin repeat protein
MVFKLLVKREANIHQASNLGITPLHVAALKGHQEVVDYLMSKGATFEATGNLGLGLQAVELLVLLSSVVLLLFHTCPPPQACWGFPLSPGP